MGMTNENRTAPLDAAVADKLLNLLSSDDSFRDHFSRDPVAALETIGYKRPAPQSKPEGSAQPELFVTCCVKQLASKEAISAARAEIRGMLLTGLNHTTPQLDANPSDDRRTLK